MLNFIYNAGAGNGRGKKYMDIISAELTRRNIDFATFETTRPKQATQIAKDISQSGQTQIIAVGGDGTINEVFNGINPEKDTFGIIPAGTGNDFIESCHIPNKPLEALEVILSTPPKSTDYLECSGIRGLNIIATGIDVEILKRCKKMKFFKGKIQYLISLIISLFKFKFYNFKIKEDALEVDKTALIVSCGNGKMFGGGIRICPEAEIDDGLIDFVVCTRMRKSKIPSAFIKLMKGKILTQPFTEFKRTTRVQVTFDRPTTVNIDGELYDDLPFDVKIISGGLMLYRP